MHQAVRCQHVTLYLRRYIFLFLFVENKIPNKIYIFSAVSPRSRLQDREMMRGASARDVSARGASLPANADARAVCVELAAFAPLNSAAG